MQHSLSARTIDDLMRKVYKRVLANGVKISPSKGPAYELFGFMLELKQPLCRVSRSQNRERVFSALGELLWYLAGSDNVDQIGHYVSYYKNTATDTAIDGHVIGAYGPRLLRFDNVNQLESVIKRLRANPASRNAVIQIFDHKDTVHAPCTLALQFVVRRGKLDMITTMRSNDLFLGFPHDVFAFTMIMELIARSLGVEVGRYYHAVGSLHLYEKNIDAARSYIGEGWHDHVTMPLMPKGDPWGYVNELLGWEKYIRCSGRLELDKMPMIGSAYWNDLALLLCAYKLIQERRISDLAGIVDLFTHDYFKPIIQDRINKELSKERIEH